MYCSGYGRLENQKGVQYGIWKDPTKEATNELSFTPYTVEKPLIKADGKIALSTHLSEGEFWEEIDERGLGFYFN